MSNVLFSFISEFYLTGTTQGDGFGQGSGEV
jgi:hypothetical protein